MRIFITYCADWNYLPDATGLAAAISEEFGTKPELFPGSDGIFDVVADGKLIFSKHEVGRFPLHEEIIEMLRSWKGRNLTTEGTEVTFNKKTLWTLCFL